MYKCKECKSEKVEVKAWVNLNNHLKVDFSLSEASNVEEYWCNDCEEHCEIIQEELN